MLEQETIEESISSWMAPVVFLPKKSGEPHDYCECNKQTQRDAYPLPLPDEVQDVLAGSAVFSILDFQGK